MAVQKVATQVIEDGAVTDAKIADIDATKLTGSIANARIPAGAVTQHVTDPITKSTSEPAADTNPSGGVGTVWLRTTTGEMYCCTDATTNANVWTNIGEGTGSEPVLLPSGGTITTDGDYKVHTFNSSGTFAITHLSTIIGSAVEYLVIAGGGCGGRHRGGGGGAGGYRTASGLSVTAQSYTVTVGGGGAVNGIKGGSDSIFDSITSVGGGPGGHNSAWEAGTALDGGSGGGGHGGAGVAGSGTSGQGNAGGVGYNGGAGDQNGGGGGGASAVGAAGVTNASGGGGNGGNGSASSITGSSVTRSGGGGGTSHGGGSTARGGSGGGGNGYTTADNGSAGTANTGGGGGSSGSGSATGYGWNGGSGVVIIRYQFQ
jgi:hypothetical protein